MEREVPWSSMATASGWRRQNTVWMNLNAKVQLCRLASSWRRKQGCGQKSASVKPSRPVAMGARKSRGSVTTSSV